MARTKKKKGSVTGTLVVGKKYRVRHGSGGLNKGDIVTFTGTDVDNESQSSTYGKTWYTFQREDGFSFRTESNRIMTQLDPMDEPEISNG